MFTTAMVYTLMVLASEDNTQSVLVPTPATQNATVAPQAVVVREIATETVVVPVETAPNFVCVDGKCRRVTSVETQTHETTRRRLFGGPVIRNSTRTVYKTSRR